MADNDEEQQSTLDRTLNDLKAGRLPSVAVPGAILDFGRHEHLAAIPVIESYLDSPDPEIRATALAVLTREFALADHRATAEHFLEHDPNRDCRDAGATALGIVMRNTGDRPTLRVLAGVVRNEYEDEWVRRAAYAAMLSILRFDPRQQLKLASHPVHLANDVDWGMVDSYLSGDGPSV